MAPTTEFHYAIIGGGITGLTLAIALHHRGLSVTLYEQAPSFKEIGAGVAFTPNAVQAMQICQDSINQAFEAVRTRNLWESKQDVWFEYYDGISAKGEQAKAQIPAFTIRSKIGNAGVHRAHFLEKLVPLLPTEIAQFGKRLQSIQEMEDGRMSMSFADGSTASADAILGCDGIKSRVRQIMFGEDHLCAHPTYTHKYAYRALVPMDDAVAALGEQKAKTSCMHVGAQLTMSISRQRLMTLDGSRWTYANLPDQSRADHECCCFSHDRKRVARFLEVDDASKTRRCPEGL